MSMPEAAEGTNEQSPKIPFKDRKPQEGSIGSGIGVNGRGFSSNLGRRLIERGHLIGSTRETNIPGSDIHRGTVERFERGEFYRAYMDFRRRMRDAEKRGEDTTDKKEEFRIFRQKATEFKKKLDTLNKQFYPYKNDWDRVDVSDPELGEHHIPVVTLDLNPPKEGEPDKRVPYFFVPTYIANPYQVAFLAMALALEGQKVHVMTYPEKYKMSESSPDWLKIVKNAGTLRPYAKLAQKVADGLILDNYNLVGTSMGAAVSLEMASDPASKGRINDLIIVDPPSLHDRNSWKMALYDYGLMEGVVEGLDREIRIKAEQSERPDLDATMGRGGGWLEAPFLWAPILAKGQITKDKLLRINPKGKFQVWIAEKSRVTGEKAKKIILDAENSRMAANPDFSPMKLMFAKGLHHNDLFSRLGVASYITKEKDPEGTLINIDEKDLTHSVSQAILKS